MTVEQLNNSKIPIIVFDKKLEQFRGKTLFPEKLAKANEIFNCSTVIICQFLFGLFILTNCFYKDKQIFDVLSKWKLRATVLEI